MLILQPVLDPPETVVVWNGLLDHQAAVQDQRPPDPAPDPFSRFNRLSVESLVVRRALQRAQGGLTAAQLRQGMTMDSRALNGLLCKLVASGLVSRDFPPQRGRYADGWVQRYRWVV